MSSVVVFQRNDHACDHYEDFSSTTSALKRVVWPAQGSGMLSSSSMEQGERQRHRSTSQQRVAQKGEEQHAVDRPMEWIKQQQQQHHHSSSERIQKEYEMEIQKKTWDVKHMANQYRLGRNVMIKKSDE
jgi:hypothetical protein